MTGGRPVIIPLGGFLGAGKTTLILAASRILQARGLRPAAILNDQGADLVDTKLVSANGVHADQVTGGCFCCRFSDLVEAADRLSAYAPDVIFAEAVGSCTDISATTLQPLKLEFGNKLQIAPYTVLVDPGRVLDLASGSDEMAFLFQKQIEEADLICFSKMDLYAASAELKVEAPVRYISPATGQGVDAWLDEVLSATIPCGTTILELDYTEYARAEAALAWLNCAATIRLDEPVTPAGLVDPLLDQLDQALTAAGFRIAHLKVLDETPTGYIKASIVRNGEEPNVEGALVAGAAADHRLLINVRAEGNPAVLRAAVEEILCRVAGAVEITNLQCFRPSPPKPERRIGTVVPATSADRPAGL